MCSVLHGQLVCVRRVVHVVGHIGLNVGENVLVVGTLFRSLITCVREFLVQDDAIVQGDEAPEFVLTVRSGTGGKFMDSVHCP